MKEIKNINGNLIFRKMKKYFISQLATFLFVMVIMMITSIYDEYPCVMAGSFVFGIIYFGLAITEHKVILPQKNKDGYLVEMSCQWLLMFVSYIFGYWIWTPLMMGIGFHFMWAMILLVKFVTLEMENK